MLTSGTEEERQELMSICVQILTNYPMTDLVTPIFVFEQLCSIIHPVSIYPSICLSTHSSIYLSIYPFIHLSVYLPIHPSICLSIHSSIYLSIYPFIHRSVYLPIHPSICLSIHSSHASIHLSVQYPSMYLSPFLGRGRCW